GSRRYSSLTQIDRGNVRRLQRAWIFHSGDGARNIEATPIIVDGTLYGPTAGRALVALDAATGRERWRYHFEEPSHPGMEDEPARRGLVYWSGARGHGPRLLVGNGNWIYALDPKSGRPIAEFGTNGRAPLPTGATVGGAIYQHVYVTAGIRGDVFGFDVRTGAQLWRFHTVPTGDEFGADTWSGPVKGGAVCWGGLSMDEERGIVFPAVGAAHPDFIGAGRTGDNLFGDTVLALDALTGRRLWYFQNVRHDVWDLDNAAPPNLVTITRNGRKVDALTSVSKTGVLLLLDRTTGQPIFPFRLRRAPTSPFPGDRSAPYQPDPELPEQYSRLEFRLDDVTDLSPEAHDFVMRRLASATHGWFLPFTVGRPNVYAGTRGGGEWSGAAVDVPKGRLFITSNRLPCLITVFPRSEGERDPKYPPSRGELVYQQNCATCHGPRREGNGIVPPLLGLHYRLTEDEVRTISRSGRDLMPPPPPMTDDQRNDLLDFLFGRNQPPSQPVAPDAAGGAYTYGGFKYLSDQNGYPGVKPPWGLLTSYDLNSGRIRWQVPLGEYPELTAKGIPVTGQENLGGASVTAGGLVFVAGTPDKMLRAFDSDTGRELWKAELPWAGYAAPAIYEAAGREFVVIAANGGGKVGGPAGDAYVAFALPE
ncbi:MAG TPA: PQQ-binding-like beta-propeller repeat protein, partial [Opitutus sp.]|nr:PQQ-binding-like beta-propeller repeat protein [Opitutus sp.]